MNKIIIVEAPGVELGILADSVLGLLTVPVAEIQPALPTLTGIREEFLRGVTRQSMVLLDAKKLLSRRASGVAGTKLRQARRAEENSPRREPWERERGCCPPAPEGRQPCSQM